MQRTLGTAAVGFAVVAVAEAADNTNCMMLAAVAQGLRKVFEVVTELVVVVGKMGCGSVCHLLELDPAVPAPRPASLAQGACDSAVVIAVVAGTWIVRKDLRRQSSASGVGMRDIQSVEVAAADSDWLGNRTKEIWEV